MQQRRLHQTRIEGRYLGALEHIRYPTAVRIKRGAVSHRQAQLFRRIDAGQTAEKRITMDSSKRKGPGCRTNQIDGLVDFVLRCLNGSLIAAGQWTPEESIVGGLFQLCSGSHASRPVSYPTVSKNRFASKGLLLFSMVYTVRPSFWARIDRALALPYLLTNLW